MVVVRYMLDTDAIIRLSESPEMVKIVADCVEVRTAEILISHVQVDELCRVLDSEALARRVLALLRVRASLVLTNIFVLDVSRLDNARLGTDQDSEAFDRHLGAGPARTRHAEDATIASTARSEQAVLVTLNRKDLNRMRRGQPDLRVIGWVEFVEELTHAAEGSKPSR